MNMYFQIGNDTHKLGKFVNMCWLNFGKLIFVTSVMVMLIQLCSYNENIPKAIANSAPVQLIGNLSFSMYGWHYLILQYSICVSETDTNFLDYFLFGAFFWVFSITFVIALWCALIFEYPCSEIWRMIETPIIRKLKN